MTDHRPLTDDELRQIREREQQATPGPWEIGIMGRKTVALGQSGGEPIMEIKQRNDTIYDEAAQRDILFIKRSRADIPRLVADCERKKAALRSAMYQLEDRSDLTETDIAVWEEIRDALGEEASNDE